MGIKSSKKLQSIASDGEAQELRLEILNQTSIDIGGIEGAFYRCK